MVFQITYWDGNKLIGFDTGPGNALWMTICQMYSLALIRRKLAAKGTPIEKEIKKFTDEFFRIPPKS